MFSPLKRLAFRKFRKAETRLHELNYLFWECTSRCNLHCLHCGSDCHVASDHPDMPVEDFLRALDTIQKPAKNFIVALTGGEPLLRNDLETVGLEIRKRDMRWGMVSNGHLYDRERHISLLNAGMGALTISVDGLEESHDWLRNKPGSFSRVDRAIELAAGTERLNFDIVTCVNRRNRKELPAIYNYLNAKGVKAWRLFTIIPIGRAKENPELNLTDREFKEMLDFIVERRKESGIDVKFSCEGYVGEYESKVRDIPFFCRAGINIGSILIDGSISACPNIDRSFIQGNIYSDNFYHIWQTKFTPFRNRSWNRKGPCADCKDYSECQGNGFHNWHGDKSAPLVCHQGKLKRVN
ncbi:MAG: TIGR04133 family radical SAM/SPASM protein [Bacteroidales bacterium]|nr:TIGR04133 family radical SAM/SPASM protein [Bacteroidales bacterium]